MIEHPRGGVRELPTWWRTRRALKAKLDAAIADHARLWAQDPSPEADSKQRVDEIEALQKALELHERRPPGFVVGAFFFSVALLLLSVFHFRVGSVDVVLELTTTELAIETVGRVHLPRIPAVRSLVVRGLDGIRWPDGQRLPGSRLALDVPEGGHLAVEPWDSDPSVPLYLAADGGDLRWRGRPVADGPALRLSALGPVRFDEPTVPGDLDSGAPVALALEPGGGDLHFAWRPVAGGEPSSFEPLAIEGLRVVFEESSARRPRLRSGILGGDLILESLAGKSIPLARGAALRLGGVRGELTHLVSDGEKWDLRFVGRVDRAFLGYGVPRNLVPTWAANLYANPSLGLLRSALIGLGSLLALTWTWLRR